MENKYNYASYDIEDILEGFQETEDLPKINENELLEIGTISFAKSKESKIVTEGKETENRQDKLLRKI